MTIPRCMLALAIPLVAMVAACNPAASPGGAGGGEGNTYPHAEEPIGTARAVYDGALSPALAVNTFRNTDRLFATRRVARGVGSTPLPAAPRVFPSVHFTDRGQTVSFERYLDENRVAAILVLQDSGIVLERYRLGNTDRTRWMSMSIAKSITSTLVGMALRDGAITSLSDSVTRYLPALAGSGYEGTRIRDVLMMASGVRWDETYTDSMSDRRRLLRAQLSQQPGAAMAVMASLPRVADPGTVYNYNTGETQVVAELLRAATGKPLATYLSERLWSRVGMEADAFWWLDAPEGTEMGGSGFGATLRDYGRFGLFLLGGGLIDGQPTLPDGWIAEATSPKRLADGTEVDYGYLWWTPTDPGPRRDGAFVGEGLYGQFLYVNPAARVVIVVWSARAGPTGDDWLSDWAFFEAVADSLRAAPGMGR